MIEDTNKRNSVERVKNKPAEVLDMSGFPEENPNPVFSISTGLRVIYANAPAEAILENLGVKDKKIPKKLFNSVINSIKNKNEKILKLELKIALSVYEFSIVRVKNTDHYNIYGNDVTEKKKLEKSKRIIEKEKILLNERNYIAKELHDTVTQTLFSANLIAEVLPKLWKKDPKSVIKRLNEIRMLNSAALTEIRALLFDLRPATFKNEDLGEHLKELVKSIGIKSRIPISIDIVKKYQYSHNIGLAFYRIAQETLNNIIKHSCATRAGILLESLPDKITLKIDDNGIGFDSKGIFSENLGLIIMKERAKMVGALLVINSSPGKGTKVSLTYNNIKKSKNNYE